MSTTTEQPPQASAPSSGDRPGAAAGAAAAGAVAGGGSGAEEWAIPGVEHRRDPFPDPLPDGTIAPPPEPEPVPDVVEQLAARTLDPARGPVGGAGAHPVIRAACDCLVALRGCTDAPLLTLTAEDVKLLILAVTQIIAAAVALRLRLLVAGDKVRAGDTIGAPNVATFLAHLTRTVRTKAASEVNIAKDLDRRYPLLAAALAAGRLTYHQLTVCVAALRKLPKNLSAEALETCQAYLIDAAAIHDATSLKHEGRKLWWLIDPDGAAAKEGKDLEDEEERARAKAWFNSWRNGDGSTGFRGKLPDAQADILLKLIHAYAAPRRAHLRRTKQNANTNNAPAAGNDGGHPGQNPPDPADTGGHETPDHEPGDPLADPPDHETHPAETSTGRRLPWPAIQGLGLAELLENIPMAAVPFTGGMPATILVMIDYEKLLTGLGTGMLDTGTPISAAQARRMACTAGLLPVVFDSDSQPLDAGTTLRFHTVLMRQVATARDHRLAANRIPTCCAEGCDRPAAWTVAHHPIPVSQGGPTSVHNHARPCEYHHHLLHSSNWTTTWLPNGKARLRKNHRQRD